MKSLFYGIAVVTLAGLALGLALRPTLTTERIGGPQIALADSGRRIQGDAGVQTLANRYPSGIPDYVIGTDNLGADGFDPYGSLGHYRKAAWADVVPDPPAAEPVRYSAVTLPTYAAEIRYPSQGGGILAGIDRAPVDLGPEVFEPADAPIAEMAAIEAERTGPVPYDRAFANMQ